MNKILVRGFAISLLIWGIILLLLPGVSLVGWTIVEDVGVQARSIIGLVFVVLGAILGLVSKN